MSRPEPSADVGDPRQASGDAADDGWLAGLARKASAQVLRGVDDGLAEAGDALPKTLERAERLVRRQLLAALMGGLAAAWGSGALFLGLRQTTPDWLAALITAAAIALVALGLHHRGGGERRRAASHTSHKSNPR